MYNLQRDNLIKSITTTTPVAMDDFASADVNSTQPVQVDAYMVVVEHD